MLKLKYCFIFTTFVTQKNLSNAALNKVCQPQLTGKEAFKILLHKELSYHRK